MWRWLIGNAIIVPQVLHRYHSPARPLVTLWSHPWPRTQHRIFPFPNTGRGRSSPPLSMSSPWPNTPSATPAVGRPIAPTPECGCRPKRINSARKLPSCVRRSELKTPAWPVSLLRSDRTISPPNDSPFSNCVRHGAGPCANRQNLSSHRSHHCFLDESPR